MRSTWSTAPWLRFRRNDFVWSTTSPLHNKIEMHGLLPRLWSFSVSPPPAVKPRWDRGTPARGPEPSCLSCLDVGVVTLWSAGSWPPRNLQSHRLRHTEAGCSRRDPPRLRPHLRPPIPSVRGVIGNLRPAASRHAALVLLMHVPSALEQCLDGRRIGKSRRPE